MPPRRPPSPGAPGGRRTPPASPAPAARKQATPKPVIKPVIKPVAKPGSKPAAKPAKPAAKPAKSAKPAVKPGTAKRRSGRPAAGRSAARSRSSRPGSSRPRPGAMVRTGVAAAGLRAGAGRPVWVIAGVVVVLALLVLPYVQKWLVQRSEIAAARAEVAAARDRVAELQEQRRRWEDPDYVKAQARERLYYVMPGETGYVVIDEVPKQTEPTDPGSQAARVPTQARPWYGDLWESVKVAGDPPAPR
jgi:cell division protein FtsB